MACGKCSGNCSTCGGCAGTLELTDGEIQMIQELGRYSFLPVARRADDMVPVYLEETALDKETYSRILQCLEKKQLISIDYNAPLAGADMSAYRGYPVHGSMALTGRGYAVLELLETQGIG